MTEPGPIMSRSISKAGLQSWPMILLVLAIGIGLSLAAYRFGIGWERNKVEHAFVATAKHMELRLKRELEIDVNIVHSLRAYFESDREEIAFKEFQAYVRRTMSRQNDIQALEWIPRVAASQRAAFEEAGKRIIGPDFQITESSADGQLVRAGNRSEYFPVYYVEPVKGNRPALGYDLGSDPTRLSALNQAADSGRAAASARVRLVQETGGAYGFLVFSPVFWDVSDHTVRTYPRDRLRGFALGVFRIPAIVEKAEPNFRESGVNVFLFDATEDKDKPVLLFGYCPSTPKLIKQPDITCIVQESGTDLHYQAGLLVGGRNWILVLVATPAYLEGRFSHSPHIVLAIGLLATLLLALLVVKSANASKTLFDKNLALNNEIIERRKAESSLAFFKYTVSKMRDAAYLMDAGGRIFYANDSACASLGFSREELLKMSLTEIDPNMPAEKWPQLWQELVQAKHQSMESSHRRKDGEIYPVEVSMNLLDFEGDSFNCAIARDITKRKRIEQSLRERDELFRSVGRMAKVGGWEFSTDTGEGIWTDEVAFIHEMDPGDKTNKAIGLSHYEGEHSRRILDAIREAEEQGKPFDLELELVTHKGNRKWVRSIGWPVKEGNKVVKIRGSFQDITERRQAEAAVKESENKFRSITENAVDYIFIKGKDRRYAFVNQAMQKLLGLPIEAILGKTPEEIFGPEQGSVIKEIDDRAFAGETISETRSLAIRGKRFFFNTIQTPLAVEDGQVISIMGIVRDVTEFKQTEEALKASQALLKNIFDASPALITLTTVEDGRYLDANNAFFIAMGYSHEEVLGKTSADLGMWSDTKDREKPKELLLQNGFLRDYEASFRMKNGEIRTFLWNAVTIVVDGELCSANVMIDITDRLYAESAIKENEMALSRQLAEINYLYQTSPVGLAFMDKDLRFLRINQSLAELNGVPVEEHLGKTIGQVLPDLASVLEPRYRQVIDTGEPITNLTIHGATSLGSADVRDWLINYHPVKAADGSIMGVGTVVQDITEIKEAERTLTRINEELEVRVAQRTAELAAANKELEAFAYSVSHDLRAPLRAMDGFSQALLEDYRESLDLEAQDYLNRIRAASQRMGVLIDDILKLSRMTRAEMVFEEVDLSRLALEIIANLREEDPQRTVEFIVQPKVTAKGDKDLLGILLENLIGNAWKYTSNQPSARIEFGALEQPGDPAAKIRAGKVFFVKDNGVGFDQKYMDKIFQPFQRLHTSEEFPGTGIGLATVQRIVHRHGGRVWCESQAGSGATFFFLLGS